MQILIAESDVHAANEIQGLMSRSGFVPMVANTGARAWELGGTESFGAAILSADLSGLDGVSVLRRWRAEQVDCPVIITSPRDNWEERVYAMETGADDCLTSAVRPEELVARVRAVIRRRAGVAASSVVCGGLSVQTATMQVFYNEDRIHLSPVEYRALHYLALNCCRIVSTDELAEHLYGSGNQRGPNAVELIIARLRRKTDPGVILTKRGFGYGLSDRKSGGSQ